MNGFSRGAQSSPQPPNRLIFCTNVQDDALNLCYARQTRTRSFVLAHIYPPVQLRATPWSSTAGSADRQFRYMGGQT